MGQVYWRKDNNEDSGNIPGGGILYNIADLKTKTDLLDIVEADIGPARKHQGRWLSFVCPFHPDSEQDGGSLRVTPDTNTWFCFGCHKSGDVIDWLCLRQNLGFREACQVLNGNSVVSIKKSPVPSSTRSVTVDASWQQAGEKILTQAQKFLWSGSCGHTLDYLHKRGLQDDTLKYWGVGYNPATYRVQDVSTSGGHPLVVCRGIVIPARVGGSLQGLKIRQADGCTPKYIQVAGSRPALFGADTLNKSVAILCEGEFDAMLLWQEAGDIVGVGTTTGGAKTWQKGWAVYLLSAQQILIAYDTDPTGEEAANFMTSLSSRARRVRVPNGKDVTEFWQSGGNLREWVLSLVGKTLPNRPNSCPICANTCWEWQSTGWVCSVCGRM